MKAPEGRRGLWRSRGCKVSDTARSESSASFIRKLRDAQAMWAAGKSMGEVCQALEALLKSALAEGIARDDRIFHQRAICRAVSSIDIVVVSTIQ